MIPFIFLLVGVVLLFLEFYTPGGLLATAGVVSVVLSVVTFVTTSDSLVHIILFILFAASLVGASIWFALYRIKRSAKDNTFYLAADQEGYCAASFNQALVGKTAEALTDLGPSGFILVDGVRYQARSRGGYVDRGQRVEIIGGDGAHIIVRTIKLR